MTESRPRFSLTQTDDWTKDKSAKYWERHCDRYVWPIVKLLLLVGLVGVMELNGVARWQIAIAVWMLMMFY